jgi:small subunit ribosomal protein S18b, mitochondrial
MLSRRFILGQLVSFERVHRACLSLSSIQYAAKTVTPAAPVDPATPTAQSAQLTHNKTKTSLRGTPYQVTDIQTSLRYIESDAYKTVYGTDPVWKNYVRNRINQRLPNYTRDFCVEEGLYVRGNPCPICRDEYLLFDYRNTKLLQQFINKHTGEIEPVIKTSLCQAQLRNLRVALRKAYDFGLLTYEVPFRTYDYHDYYPQLRHEKDRTPSLFMTILHTLNDQKLDNLDELVLTDEQLQLA